MPRGILLDGTGLPPGGDIEALVIDPHAPTRLYAAAFPGGVFQSDDGGANWHPLDRVDVAVIIEAVNNALSGWS